MLDDSYLYQKDFEEYSKKFQKLGLDEFYKNLYSSGRLLEDDFDSQNLGSFLNSYNRNLSLIAQLVRDNYELQLLVHRLGLKNRFRKKVGRYHPPDKLNRYVSPSELEDILSGAYTSKNFLPLASFSREALDSFKKLSDESFEEGLREIQKQIPIPKIENPPLVSIIIPSKDGLGHLKTLFAGFEQSTAYPNYELIVVDNASKDGTQEYLAELKRSLKLKVIHNSQNKSFSASNNAAAAQAKGTYLLFLNNDVAPTAGWLEHMVSTALRGEDIGAVGAKLVYPYKPGFANNHKIQHGGVGFRLDDDFVRPVNLNMGAGFLARNTRMEEEKAAVTAACLLVEKSKFEAVGGFDEDYWYGYEDVDLCLKLQSAGYRSIINNAAVLFHYEFGTQGKNDEKTIVGYRKKNIQIFKNKWQSQLYYKYWNSLLEEDNQYTDKRLHIAFAVTEASDKTAAGDFYTAKELGTALQDKGCKVSYIGVRDSNDPYYISPDVDVLVSMIDGYDISRIDDHKLVKIAWCRNWFERWADQPYFRDFDIVLTNSERAQRYLQEEHCLDSYIFKIATNKSCFTKHYATEELSEYASDICFTGNYWQVPRDISSLLDVDRFKDRYQIKIFGKDWDQVNQLRPFWQGFLLYKNIPKVYAAGKVLIDDATFVVNEWGSVNSRVFDGAAGGILVLTNGVEGSQNTFDGIVPTYSTKDELSELLEKYLSDDKLRQKKIKEIRDYVLANHTYDHRAEQLLGILKTELARKTVNVKLPIPRWSEARQWGDYHFGQSIKRELQKHGLNVKFQILPEWDKHNFALANIVLRGLSVFSLPEYQLNVMWNISHPEKVPLDEYRLYDYVFVASKLHADSLQKKGIKNARVLYQCFDDSVFNDKKLPDGEKYQSDLLFVGNTRAVFRKIVRDALSWKQIDKYNFRVYGAGWQKFIDKKYIGGEHIDNNELRNYYGNAKILLNDHWDDMNQYGFVSNRLFDASACGAFIISDANPGIKEIFGSGVIAEYDSPTSLHKLLDEFLMNPKERQARAAKAREIVLKDHTFAKRVEELLAVVKELS